MMRVGHGLHLFSLPWAVPINHHGIKMAMSVRSRYLSRETVSKSSMLNWGPFGSRSFPSIFRARHKAIHMKFSTIVYGSPAAMDMVCRALNALSPPDTSRAVAVAPSVKAQKIRWKMGGSGWPLAERQSITNEPLSDDVTKYNTMAASDTTDRKSPGEKSNN